MIAPTALLIASYLTAAAGLWCMLLPLVRPRAAGDTARLALVALTLGPIALAWVLAQSMRLAPGLAAATHAAIVLMVVLLPVLVLWRRATAAAAELWRAGLDAPHWYAIGFAALLAVLLGLTVAAFPIYENDALEYATAARHVYEARSAHLYPFMDSSATNGFYGPWTHPIGYTSLMVWSNIVQGGAAEAGLIRFPAYYCACATLLLLVSLAGGLGGVVAALLLVVTPIYLISTVSTAVDPVRVAAGFAAIVLVEMAARLGADAKRGFAGGVGTGLGFFAHSIGVLLIPMAAALWLLFGPAGWRARIVAIALTAITAIAVVLPDLVANFHNFNAIIADAPAAWSVPEVRNQEHVRVVRGIATFKEQVLNGPLQGLFGTVYYGVNYWVWLTLLAVTLVYGWRRFGIPAPARWMSLHAAPHVIRWMTISAALVLMWGAMAFAALLINSVEAVKNYRYALTVLPFLVLFCGLAMAAGLRQWEQGGAGLRRWGSLGACALLALAAACSLSVGVFHFTYLAIQYSIPVTRLDLGTREALTASRMPSVHVSRQIDELLRLGGCALLFRQADYAFFGTRCYRSYLDHTLVDLYRAKEPDEIAAVLARNDIRVVLVPRDGLAEIYNTGLETFLADPRRSRLVSSWDGTRLFRVGDRPGPMKRVPVARLGVDLQLRDSDGRRTNTLRGGQQLATGDGDVFVPSVRELRWTESHTCRAARIEPAIYEMTAVVKGNGHLVLDLVDHSAESTASEKSFGFQPLWDGVVSGERRIAVQFLLEPGQCAEQRIRVRLPTRGEVTFSTLELARIEGAAPEAAAFAGNLAEMAEWSSTAHGYYSKAWEWGWSVERGVIFQRLPAGLGVPEVVLGSPPVFVGPGLPPRSFVVEAELAGDISAEPFLERLQHLGTRASCSDQLALTGGIKMLRRVIANVITSGREFQTVGAVPICYISHERVTLRPPGTAGDSVRAEVGNEGYEAFRVVFVQRPAAAESGKASEFSVRRLRVSALAADGAVRVLYDFQPLPRTLPVIR